MSEHLNKTTLNLLHKRFKINNRAFDNKGTSKDNRGMSL